MQDVVLLLRHEYHASHNKNSANDNDAVMPSWYPAWVLDSCRAVGATSEQPSSLCLTAHIRIAARLRLDMASLRHFIRLRLPG